MCQIQIDQELIEKVISNDRKAQFLLLIDYSFVDTSRQARL